MNAEVYRSAAKEHVESAFFLHEEGRYALGIYVAGLAVECMLRGYRMKLDPQFDSRHDLHELWRLTQFGDVIPEHRQDVVRAAMSEVAGTWRNSYRFHSTAMLRRELVKMGQYRKIKGNICKEVCRRLVQSATTIVQVGDLRWMQQKSS